MGSAATPLSFGTHLRELLAARGDEATQSWLAKRSGVDSSLISRIMAGGRPPTLDTLQALAPALEMDLSELVAGTDAESRLAAGPDHVRLSDYQEAVGKVIEYETKIRDVESRGRALQGAVDKEERARRTAESRVNDLGTELLQNAEKLKDALAQIERQQETIGALTTALQRAISEFSLLKTRVDTLRAELARTGQTAAANLILAGIGAAAGAATMAYFLRKDEPQKPHGNRAKKTGATK
jgi:transcriptional regulator with XRE-family HTH domain